MSTTLDFSTYENKTEAIFNDGKPGLVKNTTLSVEIVQPEEGKNLPAIKLIHTDNKNRVLKGAALWELTGAEEPDALKRTIQNLGRTWKSCMGDAPFPSGATITSFWQTIAASGKTFEVFVTYGTTDKPSKWLAPRKYDFIQAEGAAVPLSKKDKDNMERLQEDREATTSAAKSDDLPF
jgi:hypothetical protein